MLWLWLECTNLLVGNYMVWEVAQLPHCIQCQETSWPIALISCVSLGCPLLIIAVTTHVMLSVFYLLWLWLSTSLFPGSVWDKPSRHYTYILTPHHHPIICEYNMPFSGVYIYSLFNYLWDTISPCSIHVVIERHGCSFVYSVLLLWDIHVFLV